MYSGALLSVTTVSIFGTLVMVGVDGCCCPGACNSKKMKKVGVYSQGRGANPQNLHVRKNIFFDRTVQKTISGKNWLRPNPEN